MNNYYFRRLRYALNFSDKNLLDIFRLVDYSLTPSELKSYLLKEDTEGFVVLPDYLFIIFLDGLIIQKRGKRDGEELMPQSKRVASAKKIPLTNNLILNKIKIALSIQADELITILSLADFRVSKGELSAFFRKPTHRNYRECGNQLMRNFLSGLTLKLNKKVPEED